WGGGGRRRGAAGAPVRTTARPVGVRGVAQLSTGGKSRDARRPIVDNPRVATMNVDRIKRGPSPRSSLTALAGRTFGAIPPPALVLLGIVSVQVGSAVAKHLFSAVGSFGTVALRLFFAAAVLMLLWRPSLRM